MREIEFRGMSGNKMVYGSLVKRGKNNPVIISNVDHAISDTDHDNWNIDAPAYVVDANTVGQYTGMYDQNGYHICEDDIIRVYEFEDRGDGEYDDILAFVEYSQWDCAFVCKKIPQNSNEEFMFMDISCTDVDIIGNIHENPELLQ